MGTGLRKVRDRGFPGSPVVKALHFHCRGRSFYLCHNN